ncbi:MAG: hypothetical protein AAB635_02050 [Patescibacteria group bacterium]
MVFPWREDRNKGLDETKEETLARVGSESVPVSYKFIGGTNNGHPDEFDKFVTGSREFMEESRIVMVADDLHDRVAHIFRVEKFGHTQYFMLFNANELWQKWESEVRREITIDDATPPRPGRPKRCAEVLGVPVWIDEDVLLSGGDMFASHLPALVDAHNWLGLGPIESMT